MQKAWQVRAAIVLNHLEAPSIANEDAPVYKENYVNKHGDVYTGT